MKIDAQYTILINGPSGEGEMKFVKSLDDVMHIGHFKPEDVEKIMAAFGKVPEKEQPQVLEMLATDPQEYGLRDLKATDLFVLRNYVNCLMRTVTPAEYQSIRTNGAGYAEWKDNLHALGMDGVDPGDKGWAILDFIFLMQHKYGLTVEHYRTNQTTAARSSR
jgi:hypothetical protein